MENEKLIPELKIVQIPIEELTPYEKNAKKHTPKQIEMIANSIGAFKFNSPIGVYSNESEGVKNLIITGHGRYEAAKRLGMKTVPCLRLDHLTDEADRRAFLLADNQTNLMTGWDSSLLGNELEGLLKLDFDMKDFGFDSKLFSNLPRVSNCPKSSELSLSSFQDEEYAYECPKCGFRYN